MTERLANTVGGVFLLVLALLTGVMAHGMPTTMQDQFAGPGFMPTLLSLCLAACAAALIVQARLLPSTERLPGWEGAEAAGAVRIVVIMAATASYNLLLEPVGYLIVTFVYLIVLQWFLRVSWRLNLAISLLGTLGTYAFFDIWLKVLLPSGLLDLYF